MSATVKYMSYVYSSKLPIRCSVANDSEVAAVTTVRSSWARFNNWLLRWLWGRL